MGIRSSQANPFLEGYGLHKPYGLRFPQVGAIQELPLPVETRSPKPLQNRDVFEIKLVDLAIAKSVEICPIDDDRMRITRDLFLKTNRGLLEGS